MLGLAVIAFLQASGAQPTPSVNVTATPEAKAKTVCTEDRVTGSRLQTKKVCRQVGPGAKDTAGQIQMRDDLRATQNNLPAPTGNGIPGQ
jgi:hypothetical protein